MQVLPLQPFQTMYLWTVLCAHRHCHPVTCLSSIVLVKVNCNASAYKDFLEQCLVTCGDSLGMNHIWVLWCPHTICEHSPLNLGPHQTTKPQSTKKSGVFVNCEWVCYWREHSFTLPHNMKKINVCIIIENSMLWQQGCGRVSGNR